MKLRVLFALTCAVILFAAAYRLSAEAEAPDLTGMTVPEYTEDGALKRPAGYEEWVFLGAALGMSYNDRVDQSSTGLFQSVFTQPEAYRYYKSTGKFAEKTMFALVLHRPKGKESISKNGHFTGDFVGIEISLKDSDTFEEGWAYFNFIGRGGTPLAEAKAMPKAICYNCHKQNAADDNVFTQFYPVLQAAKKSAAGDAEYSPSGE